MDTLNPVPAAEATDADAQPRRERGERGGRGRGRDGERRRSENPDAARPGDDTAAPLATDATATEVVEATEAGQDEQRAPRERRSRDRFGRERRERAPRDTAEATAEAGDTQPMEAQGEATESAAPARSYFSMPSAAPTDDAVAPTPTVAESTPEPQAVRAAPAVTPRAPAAPAAKTPVAAPGRSLPKVQPYQLSLGELQAVAAASGLEWVNSDAAKVAQVQAAIAAEPKPVHVPREPKPPVVLDDGPLVLVETRKDLREMALPFEQR